MDEKCIKTELFCLRCNQESIHNVEYKNKLIARVTCEVCGKTIGNSWVIKTKPLPGKLTHKISALPVEDFPQGEASDLEKNHQNPYLLFYGNLMLSRIKTKPSRINQEMHKDLTVFFCSLPVRFMTKPLRMAKEFFVLKDTAAR